MKRMLVRQSSNAQVLGALIIFLCAIAFVAVNIATSSSVDVMDDSASLGGGSSISTSSVGTLTSAPGPDPCQAERDSVDTARTNLINAQAALNQARNDFYAVRGSYEQESPEYMSAAAELETASQQLDTAIQALATAVENLKSCQSSL